jgi:hypothetical protein
VVRFKQRALTLHYGGCLFQMVAVNLNTWSWFGSNRVGSV